VTRPRQRLPRATEKPDGMQKGDGEEAAAKVQLSIWVNKGIRKG
jgi:hypothetical protein